MKDTIDASCSPSLNSQIQMCDTAPPDLDEECLLKSSCDDVISGKCNQSNQDTSTSTNTACKSTCREALHQCNAKCTDNSEAQCDSCLISCQDAVNNCRQKC